MLALLRAVAIATMASAVGVFVRAVAVATMASSVVELLVRAAEVGPAPALGGAALAIAGGGVVCVVTVPLDGGAAANATTLMTLRSCIEMANARGNASAHGGAVIVLAPQLCGAAIVLGTPLPTITAHGTTITTSCAGTERLVVVSGERLSQGSGLVFNGTAAHGSVQGIALENFPSHGIEVLCAGVSILGPFRSANNRGNGIAVQAGGVGCTVGSRARGNATHASNAVVVTGNRRSGVHVYAANVTLFNARVGVRADGDGMTADGNLNGILLEDDASDCVIGLSRGMHTGSGTTVISGNAYRGSALSANPQVGYGIYAKGPRLRVANTRVGVAADGVTAAPNAGRAGLYIHVHASDCTIGSAVSGATNVISGNRGAGIYLGGPRPHVFNTLVGVAADGTAPVANEKGGVLVAKTAEDGVIGAPGRRNTTVVSGNEGGGITALGPRLRVLNTLVGVASDGVTAVITKRAVET